MKVGTPTLLCLLLALSMASCRIIESPQTYCGRALAEALMHYCTAKDDILMSIRQQPHSPDYVEAVKPEDVEVVDELEEKQHKYNILTECCQNPCYVSQLLSFCS